MQKCSLWFAVSNGEPFVCHALAIQTDWVAHAIVRMAWAIQAKKNLHPFALDGFTSFDCICSKILISRQPCICCSSIFFLV